MDAGTHGHTHTNTRKQNSPTHANYVLWRTREETNMHNYNLTENGLKDIDVAFRHIKNIWCGLRIMNKMGVEKFFFYSESIFSEMF